MSELKELIVDVVEKIFSDHIQKESVDLLETGKWATDVWDILTKNEITKIAVPDRAGGANGDIEDLLSLYYVVGKYAAPIPFVEMTLANYFLDSLNMATTPHLITYALPKHTAKLNKDRTVSGMLANVPWARHAKELVLFTTSDEEGMYAVHIELNKTTIQFGTNLAAEPRDTVIFNNIQIKQQSTTPLTNEQFEFIKVVDTAAKNACIAGAIDTIFKLSVQFSKDRKQFGRPIHRFQLVQQHLAILAGEQMISSSSLENIIAPLIQKKHLQEVAYMRIRLDDSIRVVTSSAHQIHAAIGVTHEYPLHQLTKRCWSWREEGYTSTYWRNEVARTLLQSTENIWSFITKQ